MAWRKLRVVLEGVSPYVPHRFSGAAKEAMEKIYEEGLRRRSRKEKEAKDPVREAENGLYRDAQGRIGFPSLALRRALTDSAVVIGFVRSRVGTGIEVEPQAYERETGMPLILFKKHSEPRLFASRVVVRSGGADVRYRYAIENWQAECTVLYDDRLIDENGIRELLTVAGSNVGIGDGRPKSPNSPGLGWGRFRVVEIKSAE